MTLKEKVLQAASGEKLPAGVQMVSGALWIKGLTHAKTSFLELDPDLHEDHVIWRMAALALGIRDDERDFQAWVRVIESKYGRKIDTEEEWATLRKFWRNLDP